MTLSERIEEIIRSHYNDIIVDKSILAPKSLTVAILKAVEESLPKEKDLIYGKEIITYEKGYNQALKEVRQRLGM